MDRTRRTFRSFDEAWGIVIKARNQCGRDEPLKAYAMMDELTLVIVKNLGWYNICTTENDASVRANFRAAYEERIRKEQNNMQLPDFVAENKLQIQERYTRAIEDPSISGMEE